MVLVGGIMASGKTTFGSALRKKLHNPRRPVYFVDIDEVSKAGIPPLENQEGENASLPPPLLGESLWENFMDLYQNHLLHGKSGIFVGTFRESEKRRELVRFAQNAGYDVIGIFFDYSPAHVIERAVKRAMETNNTHLLKAEEASELITDWRKQFEAQYHPDLENGHWLVIRDPHISQLDLVASTMEKLSLILEEQREGSEHQLSKKSLV